MADKKISNMTYMSGSNVDLSADWIPYVDISDTSNQNKKINIREINASTALVQNTTINLSSSQDAVSIQNTINSVPKNLNGYSDVFQFGDGNYNFGTSSISFSGFVNGNLVIYGNTGEGVALHTNQAVSLNWVSQSASQIGMYIYNVRSSFITISNIKFSQQAVIAEGCRSLFMEINNGSIASIKGNYFVEATNTFVDHIKTSFTDAYILNNNFTRGAYDIMATDMSYIVSVNNVATSSNAYGGLYAITGGVIAKSGNQPSASVAETSSSGGWIR